MLSVTLVLTVHARTVLTPYMKVTAWGDVGGGRYGSIATARLALSAPLPQDPEELLSAAVQALSSVVQS